MAGADYSDFIWRNGVHMPDRATMGDEHIAAEFRKSWPWVIIDGSREELTPTEANDRTEYFFEQDGYRLQARVRDTVLDMELVEPDGTIWQGQGGYHWGVGFEDECGTAQECYQRDIQGAHFQWTPVKSSAPAQEADE